MPKISIIITTHNDEKYLKTCLDAILAQTFADFEAIIIDDASEDKTPEIIKSYAKKDSRIKPYFLEENGGISASRNFGLSKASAEYIMFCDGDDYYAPTMCEKMFSAIHTQNTDIGICEIKVFYEAHHEMKFSDDCYYKLKFSGRHLIDGNIIHNIDTSVDNKIFRKSLVEKHQLRFPVGLRYEDSFFVTAYMFASNSAFFVYEPLYYYFRHEGSFMSQTWSKQTEEDSSIDNIRIFVELHALLAREKLLQTKKHYDFFWTYFCDYIYAAHNWCKSAKMRETIRDEISDFVGANEEEIATKTSSSTRKYLAEFTSPRFYSTSWKVVSKLKHITKTLAQKLSHRFCKISTSQNWSLIKLRGLTVSTNYLRSHTEILRKTKFGKPHET
ncbi:MAG: glycosyltransferase family 2 protein [Candidatus Saccharibacteria bacterium]|nr:glycosyltransferase family 2 protein [Candidatus Saccharibacteria bacterium]